MSEYRSIQDDRIQPDYEEYWLETPSSTDPSDRFMARILVGLVLTLALLLAWQVTFGDPATPRPDCKVIRHENGAVEYVGWTYVEGSNPPASCEYVVVP